MKEYIDILGLRVSAFSKSQIYSAITTKDFDTGRYVCVSNVHMCIERRTNSNLNDALTHATFVIADGKPLCAYAKFVLGNQIDQIRGIDLFKYVVGSTNLKIGLYGGRDISVLSKVEEYITNNGDCEISYSEVPPFRLLSDYEIGELAHRITEANVDILFVGLGCPKQEILMNRLCKHVRCVMVGVGAVFDFISGEKKEAPKLLQNMYLEWFYRLLSDPRRLFKRYLITNSTFLCLTIYSLIKRKLHIKEHD